MRRGAEPLGGSALWSHPLRWQQVPHGPALAAVLRPRMLRRPWGCGVEGVSATSCPSLGSLCSPGRNTTGPHAAYETVHFIYTSPDAAGLTYTNSSFRAFAFVARVQNVKGKKKENKMNFLCVTGAHPYSSRLTISAPLPSQSRSCFRQVYTGVPGG